MELNCTSVVTHRAKEANVYLFSYKGHLWFLHAIKMQGCYIQSHVRDLANEIVTDILENLSQNALMDNTSPCPSTPAVL